MYRLKNWFCRKLLEKSKIYWCLTPKASSLISGALTAKKSIQQVSLALGTVGSSVFTQGGLLLVTQKPFFSAVILLLKQRKSIVIFPYSRYNLSNHKSKVLLMARWGVSKI